jgi:ABC-2 type transport system permease protein
MSGVKRVALAPQAGSLIWLAAFDLRLGVRAIAGAAGARLSARGWIVLAAAMVGMLLMVRPVSRWLAALAADPAQGQALDGAMVAGVLIVLPWLFSHALTGATRALYSRGDLDLILTSPLPPARILAARSIAICIEATLAVALFLLPLIASLIWFGGLRWLALAPTLAGLGLTATAFGVALALGLFALIGPRRTRQVAQVVAMLIGATFVILLQALNFLPDELDRTLAGLASQGQSGLPVTRLFWAPIKGAQGDLIALAGLLAFGFCAMALMARLLGGFFLSASLRAAGAPLGATKTGSGRRARFFRPGPANALRWKEWKLLARDPWLAGHLAMQAIYTLPIIGGLWRLQPQDEAIAFLLGPTAVIVAAQLSASLAWVAISSEDAPDLLAAAPVSASDQRRRKLEAVATPLALVLAPLVIGLGFISLADAAIVAACAIGAAGSTALINLWRPAPARRIALGRRHSQSKLVALVEHFIAILWGMMTLLILQDKAVWLGLLALAAVTLWLHRPAPDSRKAG